MPVAFAQACEAIISRVLSHCRQRPVRNIGIAEVVTHAHRVAGWIDQREFTHAPRRVYGRRQTRYPLRGDVKRGDLLMELIRTLSYVSR
jgi:hypothetical protein